MDLLFFFKLQLDIDYRKARYDLEKELERIESIQKQPESFLKNKRKLQEELDSIASVIPAK